MHMTAFSDNGGRLRSLRLGLLVLGCVTSAVAQPNGGSIQPPYGTTAMSATTVDALCDGHGYPGRGYLSSTCDGTARCFFSNGYLGNNPMRLDEECMAGNVRNASNRYCRVGGYEFDQVAGVNANSRYHNWRWYIKPPCTKPLFDSNTAYGAPLSDLVLWQENATCSPSQGGSQRALPFGHLPLAV